MTASQSVFMKTEIVSFYQLNVVIQVLEADFTTTSMPERYTKFLYNVIANFVGVSSTTIDLTSQTFS